MMNVHVVDNNGFTLFEVVVPESTATHMQLGLSLTEKGWTIHVADLAYDLREFVEEAFDEPDPGEMDGDFDAAMTSAGFGTDEDYGYFGD